MKLGKKWGSSTLVRELEIKYPNPPLILFVANNEHPKLLINQFEEEKRYADLYGYEQDDNFKRRVAGEGWRIRYCNLFKGFRDGFKTASWKKNSRFVGYGAVGPWYYGRWSEWNYYTSFYVTNYYKPPHPKYNLSQNGSIIDNKQFYWDGGSGNLYIAGEDALSRMDNSVTGPIFTAMNSIFMNKEATTLRPDFFFEISTGLLNLPENETISTVRYGGYAQFLMWLLRPRIVRDYKPWDHPLDEIYPSFEPIINAVNRVHTNKTLERFWRQSELVSNDSYQHPYEINLLDEYKDVDRMFLLSTDKEPEGKWQWGQNVDETILDVMCLARQRGKMPKREWLVYCYAPAGNIDNVTVTIPYFKDIQLKKITVGGAFYLVKEKDQENKPLLTYIR